MLDRATKRPLDAILAAWSALWILVSVAVYQDVRGRGALADAVTITGSSLDNTADTLDAFSAFPLVGGRLSSVARDALTPVDRLAWLLGLSVPAAAILPVGLAYALLRVRRP